MKTPDVKSNHANCKNAAPAVPGLAGHAEPAPASSIRRRGARRRIDRRLPDVPQLPLHASDDLVVKLPGQRRSKVQSYDFDSLGVPREVAALWVQAARLNLVSLALPSQQAFWYSFRAFARFVAEDGRVLSVSDVDTEMVARYQNWLDRQTCKRTGNRWRKGTRAKRLTDFRTVIRTIKATDHEMLRQPIHFPTWLYPDREPPPRRCRLDEEELKSLLWFCQQEIRGIRQRFKTGQEIIAGTGRTGHDPMLCRALEAVHELNGTGFPSSKAMKKSGMHYRHLKPLGGLAHLRSYLSLTPDTAVPYLVALIVQLAGNVEPVRNLSRGCAVPHRTDDRVTVIQWTKPRSGTAPERIQERSFPSSWKFAPPRLVADLLELTEPILSRVSAEDEGMLFLCGSTGYETFGAMRYCQVASRVKPFLSRANAAVEAWNSAHPAKEPKTALPDFDLRDLRGSVATQHYLASRGDIRKTQRVLNHKSPETTHLYINNPLTHDINAAILSSLQRKLMNHLCADRSPKGRSPGREGPAAPSFGHD